MLERDGFGRAWVSCPEDDAAPPFWVWDQLLGQLGSGGAWHAITGETDPELTGSALPAGIGPERTLALGGLAPGELAASVRLATGSDVPGALLTGLHARTAGNPYFAAEAVRLLRAEGLLYTSAQLPAGLLPDTVRAVLERRLARLPAQVTELLAAAALLGDELDPPLLAEVSGEPLTMIAAALATARAVRVTGPDRFAHPLVREVLQSQLGPVDRLRWHTRIGELLARRYQAGTAGPAAAARHLLAAAELGGKAGPAVEFARLAAADATRRTGYEDAVRLLDSALPLTSTGSDRGELLSELGEAALAAGDQDRPARHTKKPPGWPGRSPARSCPPPPWAWQADGADSRSTCATPTGWPCSLKGFGRNRRATRRRGPACSRDSRSPWRLPGRPRSNGKR